MLSILPHVIHRISFWLGSSVSHILALPANVEIKEGKRISFRIAGTDQGRFVRGDRIGEDYSRGRILERLAEPKKKKREKVLPPTESREGELPKEHQLSNKQPVSYNLAKSNRIFLFSIIQQQGRAGNALRITVSFLLPAEKEHVNACLFYKVVFHCLQIN